MTVPVAQGPSNQTGSVSFGPDSLCFINKVTATEDFTLTSVGMIIASGTVTGINMFPVVWSDSGGSPGAILETGSVVTDGVVGLNTLPLSSSTFVTSGTVLWVGVMQEPPSLAYGTDNTGTDTYYFRPYANPASANPSVSQWNQILNIYAIGTIPDGNEVEINGQTGYVTFYQTPGVQSDAQTAYIALYPNDVDVRSQTAYITIYPGSGRRRQYYLM